jgi:hypothetical protein
MVKSSAERLGQVLGREGLGEEELRCGAQSKLAHLICAFGGHEAEADSAPLGSQRIQELETRHLGHVPVTEDEVGYLGPYQGQGRLAVLGLQDLVVPVARLAKRALECPAHRHGVVHDQDPHRLLSG